VEERPEDGEEGNAEPLSFEEARERLRARGYLDRGVEGAVLKGVSSRSRACGVLLGAAVAATLPRDGPGRPMPSSSRLSPRCPWDGPCSFLWLLLGSLFLALVLVTALGGVAWLRLSPARGPSTPAEMGVVLPSPRFARHGPARPLRRRPLCRVRRPLRGGGRVRRGPGPGFTTALLVSRGKAVLDAPARPASGAGIVASPPWRSCARRGQEPRTSPVATANAHRAIVVGLDGYSDRFLPAGTGLFPRALRIEGPRDPAAFWTSVATGESAAARRGRAGFVRVAGVSAPLRPAAASALYPEASPRSAWRGESRSRRRRARSHGRSRTAPDPVWRELVDDVPRATEAARCSRTISISPRDRGASRGEAWPEEAEPVRPAGAPAAGAGVARLVADAEGWDVSRWPRFARPG
jgi:hypothetical protein